jgi:hypothetical protein
MSNQTNRIIKCLLFDIDKVLITEIAYVMTDPDDVSGANCKLVKPYLFLGEDKMDPWPSASNQTEVMISSEKILTIADPAPSVLEKYLELTA